MLFRSLPQERLEFAREVIKTQALLKDLPSSGLDTDWVYSQDLITLAGLLLRGNQHEEAVATYQSALRFVERWSESRQYPVNVSTKNPHELFQKLSIYYALGKVHMRIDRRETAIDWFSRIATEAEFIDPLDWSSKQLLAEANHYIAHLIRSDSPKEARACARIAESVWLRMKAEKPLDRFGERRFSNADLDLQLGHNANLLGAIESELGIQVAAIEYYERACGYYRATIESNRDAPWSAHRGLANALHSLGRSHREAGDHSRARNALAEATRIRAILVASQKNGSKRDEEDLRNSQMALEEVSQLLANK